MTATDLSEPAKGTDTRQNQPSVSLLSADRSAVPCLFIVGAPRCGTSSLTYYLRHHPDICFSTPKETHFFLSRASDGPADKVGRLYRRRYFPTLSASHKILGEGSVSYLYTPEAIARALEVFPKAKFIALVRNPIDLVVSYHDRMLYLAQETVTDFTEAWSLQEARARGQDVPRACRDPRLLQYREVGLLAKHLAGMFEVAGRERCHVIVLDDLIGNPLLIYREVLDFVGVPYDGRMEFPRKNSQKGFRYQWLQRLYYGGFLVPIAPLVSRGGLDLAPLRRYTKPLRKRIRRVNKAPAKAREPLRPDLRAELAKTFEADLAALGELLDRDFSHWT